VTALEPVKIAWDSLRLAGTVSAIGPGAHSFSVPQGTENESGVRPAPQAVSRPIDRPWRPANRATTTCHADGLCHNSIHHSFSALCQLL